MKHKNVNGYLYKGETNTKVLTERMKFREYVEPIWGTYNQWIQNGRFVTYGENGTRLFGRTKSGRVKTFSVFNVIQTKKIN